MSHDLTARAKVVWHFDEEEPPEDWSGATDFPTLREAIEAIVNGVPLTGHPWILSGGRILAPHEIEALWEDDPDDPTR
jgi:hypothetical protein